LLLQLCLHDSKIYISQGLIMTEVMKNGEEGREKGSGEGVQGD